MMTQISVARNGSDYVLRLTDPQRAVISSALELIAGLAVPDGVIILLVGCDRSRISEINARVNAGEIIGWSESDLHSIHASLASAPLQFPSEEAFYTRIGFFRENVGQLAEGLARAVGGVAQ